MSNKVSKTLCYILRHKPEEFKLTVDEFGWVDVQELVNVLNINIATLVSIVKLDDKGRYEFNEETTKIRATQGHSFTVNLNLTNVVEVFENVYHGTSTRVSDLILASGLLPINRQYVHMCYDLDQAHKTGARHGSPVIFKVDVNSAIKDGFKFFKSSNGYILSEHVPAKYLEIIK